MKKKKVIKVIRPGTVCWSCEHIYFSTAEGGYSEWTPGSDFEMRCSLGHWEFEQYEDGLDKFREKLQTAEICKDFKKRQILED